jgi:transcriptional regulator with XRE-family HTH domain
VNIPSKENQDPLGALDRDFGSAVRAARLTRRMTQERLAEALNRDFGYNWRQTTVGRMESGERPTRLREAVSIAVILEVDLADLVPNPNGNVVENTPFRLPRADLERLRDIIEAILDTELTHDVVVAGNTISAIDAHGGARHVVQGR